MKKLLFAFALILGTGASHEALAGGREGQGWTVTTVTGTAWTVAEGKRIFLKRMILSSATTNSTGEYMMAFATVPNVVNGAGVALMPNHLFCATAAVTPPLIFHSSNVVEGAGINNVWSAGDGPDDFIEIPPFTTEGKVGGALHIRKPDEASGGARTLTVQWSY